MSVRPVAIHALKAAGVAALIIGGFDALVLIVRLKGLTPRPEFFTLIAMSKAVVFAALMLGHGGRISGRRFPLQRGYQQWLKTTPWRVGVPLPLGPVIPDLADLTRPIIFTAAALIDGTGSPLIPFTAFAIGYAIPAISPILRFGRKPVGIALLIALPGLVRLMPDLQRIFPLAIGMFAAAGWALNDALRAFPWHLDEVKFFEHGLGDRHDHLSPKPSEPYRFSTVAATSTVLGWWLFCLYPLMAAGRPDFDQGAMMLVGLLALLCALIRFGLYCGTFKPPISFHGRLRNGRWIIPGYDYVLLSPLAIAIIGCGLPITLASLGVPGSVAVSLGFALTILAAYKLPPTIRRWELTGHHRLAIEPIRPG